MGLRTGLNTGVRKECFASTGIEPRSSSLQSHTIMTELPQHVCSVNVFILLLYTSQVFVNRIHGTIIVPPSRFEKKTSFKSRRERQPILHVVNFQANARLLRYNPMPSAILTLIVILIIHIYID
jgi:hypothetical protein